MSLAPALCQKQAKKKKKKQWQNDIYPCRSCRGRYDKVGGSAQDRMRKPWDPTLTAEPSF